MEHLLLRIVGRVQGVGYRAWLADLATAHGLCGWVRNRADGSVEAQLHGPAAACAIVAREARRGPPGARVSDVAVTHLAEPDAVPRRFEILPTV